MFVRRKRSSVDVEVRVDLDAGHRDVARLQDDADRAGNEQIISF